MLVRKFLLTAPLCDSSCVVSSTSESDHATGGGSVALLEVNATERKFRRKLHACELSYRVAFEDSIHRYGAITLLRGSISFSGFADTAETRPEVAIRVEVFDITEGEPRHSPLDYAFITMQDYSTLGRERSIDLCDSKGICLSFSAMDNIELGIHAGQDFGVGIKRSGASTNIIVPIALSRSDPRVREKFATSAQTLMKSLHKGFN
jgi:hypothetical protein